MFQPDLEPGGTFRPQIGAFYWYSGRFFTQTREEIHDKTTLRSAPEDVGTHVDMRQAKRKVDVNWALQFILSMIWTPTEFANVRWIYNCFCATSTNLSFPSSFVLWLWTRQWAFLMRNGAGSTSLWKWTSWTPTPWGLSSDRLATSSAAPSPMPSLWSVICSFKHEPQQPIGSYYWRSVSRPHTPAHRNSSKMAANLKTWVCTTSPRESTASASPSLVSFPLLTSH